MSKGWRTYRLKLFHSSVVWSAMTKWVTISQGKCRHIWMVPICLSIFGPWEVARGRRPWYLLLIWSCIPTHEMWNFISALSKLVCETGVYVFDPSRRSSPPLSLSSLTVLPITFLSYHSDGASRKMLVAPATTATADSSAFVPISVGALSFL